MAGTRWVKIDVGYLRNPKISALSPSATLLHLASILWTADQLTDGHIPNHVLPELALMAHLSRSSAATRAGELVKAGVWDSNGADWYLHDFDVMNPQALRGVVEAQRAKWREHKKQP
jgi:hypothetical protein